MQKKPSPVDSESVAESDAPEPAAERPLRILMVTSDKYPPFRPAAKAIFGDEFARRGHVVDWVMQAEKPADGSGVIDFHRGQVHLAPTSDGTSRMSRLGKHLRDKWNDLKVLRLVARGNYDFVQVKDKYIAAILALRAARRAGLPCFYWLAYPHPESSMHQAAEGIARYPLFYRLRGWMMAKALYGWILSRCTHAFVQSEQMRRDIAAEGIPADKMTAVPSSLNIDEVPFRGDGKGPDADTLLYVGTFFRPRRLDFLIRVLAEVVKRRPAAKLIMLGKGENPEDMDLLQAEIDRLGVQGSVEFPGHVPGSEVWEYVRRAAICLSPYYPSFVMNSTSPTKLIEYMAMGRPVVANDHPEQKQVLADSQAGLCVPWQESAFADAICRLLESPEEAAEMGRRGRRWIEANRTNGHMADLVLATYRQCLAGISTDRSAAPGTDKWQTSR